MLILASLLLSTVSFASAPSCPAAFSVVNTTIGAISDSSQLNLCVSNATFIKGTNGSLNLVLGSSTNNSPKCLVYPNGLSLDLTYGLITSGHVGCWSLYPPNQWIAIVNIGRPNQTKISSALKSYRPQVPKIFINPSKNIEVGTKVSVSSSAKTESIKTTLLNLPAQIRFKPVKYSWQIRQGGQKLSTSSMPAWTFTPSLTGDAQASLSVWYSIEYSFTGLTPWAQVRPNIGLVASPLSFKVGVTKLPERPKDPPRLVDKPCQLGSKAWRC
jgi:hypothetical protein